MKGKAHRQGKCCAGTEPAVERSCDHSTFSVRRKQTCCAQVSRGVLTPQVCS
ncbi:transposase [Anopheles sinensis]|uniref:Transposase n=1 Tax=Anopheles sinensis TaxID=74873 RepID=A0A084VKI6_ANOSI|nr:transposase [Anopheles sinensis]